MNDEVVVKVHSYGSGRSLSLVYFDPVSGRKKAKSSSTTNWREAERAAKDLQDKLRAGADVSPNRITWTTFRERYAAEVLANLSASYQSSASSALNHMERILNPDRLARVTTEAVSRFVTALRKEGMKESTLACYMRALKAAFRWGKRLKLMGEAPDIQRLDAGDAKGRPLTEAEFQDILDVTPLVRPHDGLAWQRFLTGLWLSGLRLGEGIALSWESDAPFAVDLSGQFPAFRIEGRAQKSRKTQRLPMTPDFAEWLLATPETERVGRVFTLINLVNGQPASVELAMKVIGDIGKRAGIIVNREAGKYASAHDLRRSFGTRWSRDCMPADLQRLMRHQSINTTLKYYINIEADDIAARLWAKHADSGNKVGNNGTDSTMGETAKSAEMYTATRT
jgi:integrase